MSYVLNGIYGRPRGKTGGVVWGAARSQDGKVATAREYVIPHDPRTTDQIQRRNIFTEAVAVARAIGSVLWQADWNNSEGKLPGWQSLLSYLIEDMEVSNSDIKIIDSPAAKSLGPCYMPTMSSAGEVPSKITLTWGTEIVGDHCAETDVLRGFTAVQTNPGTAESIQLLLSGTARSAGTYSIADLTSSTDYFCMYWFRHTESDGSYTYSPCFADIVTSGAAS